jgi:hypothetical protein
MSQDEIALLMKAIRLKRQQLDLATRDRSPDRKRIKNELLELVSLYTEQGVEKP